MELLIQINGICLMILALTHLSFPRFFKWSEQLTSLSLANRQIMYAHTAFIALLVLLTGLLCLTSAGDLLHTTLGQRICLGMAIFWGARLLAQFFWYSPKLWRGKRFETCAHIGATILWADLVVVFALAWLG